ncbi:MAG: FtsX-like permease family protein [Saprospiraceae bacterium]
MLQNYLVTLLRSLKKNKFYTIINVFGLAAGLACFFLMGYYIKDELSYDRYHPDYEQIYRVVEIIKDTEESASCPFSVGPGLLNDFPAEVAQAVRFFNFQAPSLSLEYQADKKFREKALFFVDSTVFEVFAFDFEQGDAKTALEQPNSIVLTQSMARKYFGEENPMGKMLKYEGKQLLQVTGVLADVKPNSHFTFDALLSFSTLKGIMGSEPQGWVWNPNWTYVKLKKGVTPSQLEALMPDFVSAHFPNFIKADVTLYLQSLKDIHLHSHLDYEIQPNSDISYIYIFLAIALFVILIAAINYINLATARSAQRAKEVGMRKTLGAQKSQLVLQFLGESVLTCLVAGVLAMGLLALLIPPFNALAGKTFSLGTVLGDPFMLGAAIMTILILGLLGGLYPAFFLSSFKPISVLKDQFSQGKKGVLLRKSLVVGQFAISIILMVGTLVSYQQLQLLQTKNLGFNKDQIMVIPVQLSPIVKQFKAFKNAISQSSAILEVTGMELPLGAAYQNHEFRPEGAPAEDWQYFPSIFVLPGFTETFGITMVAGRTFSADNESDATDAIIVNETLVKQMGWESPAAAIGKQFATPGADNARIIGVMKDFNAASLHQPITPFAFDLPNNENQNNFFTRYYALRINSQNIQETVAHVERVWNSFDPDRPLDFFFLDDRLNELYAFEQRINKAAGAFSLLAIFIACLGLLGLAAYTAERKAKEIGIRKVLGASTSSILNLLSREYTVLILIAFIIASPLAYWLLQQWLAQFAYQTSLHPALFFIAGLVTIVLSWLTVSFQSLKAARANPVDSIRIV